jgi:hypothetical protein
MPVLTAIVLISCAATVDFVTRPIAAGRISLYIFRDQQTDLLASEPSPSRLSIPLGRLRNKFSVSDLQSMLVEAFAYIARVGSNILEAISAILYAATGETRINPPAGSRPIDETPWSGDHRAIKDGIGAEPSDSVRISPDGDVWGENSDGSWSNHGPAGDYTGSRASQWRNGQEP